MAARRPSSRRALCLVVALFAGLLTGSVGATAAVAAVGGSVPIKVFRGPDGAVAAVVQLRIGNAHGYFIVDTGAQKSMIDTAVAKYLRLPAIGRRRRICGVGGCAPATRLVRVTDWSAGAVALPTTRLARSRFLVRFPNSIIAAGLLGADVLSAYGHVNIDWARSVMTLGDATATAPPPTPPLPSKTGDSGATPAPSPQPSPANPSPDNPSPATPGAGLVAG